MPTIGDLPLRKAHQTSMAVHPSVKTETNAAQTILRESQERSPFNLLNVKSICHETGLNMHRVRPSQAKQIHLHNCNLSENLARA